MLARLNRNPETPLIYTFYHEPRAVDCHFDLVNDNMTYKLFVDFVPKRFAYHLGEQLGVILQRYLDRSAITGEFHCHAKVYNYKLGLQNTVLPPASVLGDTDLHRTLYQLGTKEKLVQRFLWLVFFHKVKPLGCLHIHSGRHFSAINRDPPFDRTFAVIERFFCANSMQPNSDCSKSVQRRDGGSGDQPPARKHQVAGPLEEEEKKGAEPAPPDMKLSKTCTRHLLGQDARSENANYDAGDMDEDPAFKDKE